MRQVRWSQEARNDLLGISLFISQADANAAERVIRTIQSSASSLALAPTLRRGRTKGLLERSVPGTRYVIAFVRFLDDNSEEVFFIKRIVHTSRDWRPGKPPPK